MLLSFHDLQGKNPKCTATDKEGTRGGKEEKGNGRGNPLSPNLLDRIESLTKRQLLYDVIRRGRCLDHVMKKNVNTLFMAIEEM